MSGLLAWLEVLSLTALMSCVVSQSRLTLRLATLQKALVTPEPCVTDQAGCMSGVACLRGPVADLSRTALMSCIAVSESPDLEAGRFDALVTPEPYVTDQAAGLGVSG